MNIAKLNTEITMSSLEIVDLINSTRKTGEAELQHYSFMEKVLKVLGVDAQKFLGIYKDSLNREKKCYYFHKREACLMAMSYSYELQSKVYDRWQELEKVEALPAVTDAEQRLQRESDWMLRMGYPTGVVQATIIERDDKHYNATGQHILSDKAIEFHKLNPTDSLTWNRSVEATTRSAAAVALPHFVIHTVTEIAQSYNSKYVTATVINNALTDAGYQVKLARATYTKTALSEDYAQTRIRAQGTFRGLPIITGWKMHPEFISVLTNKLTTIA